MDGLAYIPWFAWIAIAGIVVWGITAIAGMFGRKNTELTKAVEQSTAVNEKLLAKLDTIDGRLGAVEKTLKDIPE
ncbi:hypothetical protein [Agromyces cerinus]|uniref:Uncharacterized protein n=1 Tax=Agromyces cerinus subsp. cerinus TaxID=232089 RepID=A0A1N6E2K5_9MICO|nr:hypothetical protein [Agromyces cerinus]SIN77249.1 hypothetical protein SAMN05443544_1012 [Agromyces cerinus subsp. cerinus]